MNVLQLVTTPRPFFEQQVQILEENGVSCTVLTVPDSERERRSVLDYAQFYTRVLRSIGTDDFDLVHANYGLTAPMALAQPTRPVVLSFWGSDVFGRYEPVSQLCARFADEVIVMSEEMADSVNTEVTVIPHCIDFDLFEPIPQEAAQSEIGWDSDATHILFPYDPSREVKNYPRAERIVERARERLSDPVQLHAVSGVPHERIPFYMNAADVLLLTSRWEGSPNAVREALAVGLPVVATDVGDIRTRVAGVSPSAVGQTDESLVDELVTVIRRGERSNGREQHANLSLDWMGDRILEVYQRALGSEY